MDSIRVGSGNQVRGDGNFLGGNLDAIAGRPPASTYKSSRLAVDQQDATPHAVRLAAIECVLETRCTQRTFGAHRLGASDIDVVVGEEERSERARTIGASGMANREWLEDGVGVEAGGSHVHISNVGTHR